MYDRHNKASDALAMMSVASGMDGNKGEDGKASSGCIKEIIEGKMVAEIYAQGEALIQVRYARVALEPGELRALHEGLKQHYGSEASNARPEI